MTPLLEHMYTPISLIKKTFKTGERSLSRDEILHRLRSMAQVEDQAAEPLIQLALDQPSSPFREGSSRAVIEYVQESQPLSQHVLRILQETGSPLSEEQILRKLRSLNLISWSFSFERLGLMGDHRFSQLSDGRWIMSEWEIVNDEIFELILRKETKEILMKDIPYIVQMVKGMSKRKNLFLPELDVRFRIVEDKILLQVDTQPMAEEQASESNNNLILESQHTSIMEVAAAMNQETLELVEVAGEKTVVDQVVEDLMGALIKLEKRSAEMKDEVITHFTANNLDAIKSLMSEKEKNEKVLLKIKDIVNDLS
ncbi:hypothetical protein [Ammoniphilus sp. CFH 90114]|uniref:hypothetical protein n=1 Tax=Ammoniphilus sp. CFH 90114 TaxID=2493665 RepID=UPI00100FF998|nr:hypothetical protein [Ammoniphilus sp. CFH 90114]RXT13604.1 hypothetical protein EIZ39_05490 [Ammoniphilus sp. CFH 90114]